LAPEKESSNKEVGEYINHPGRMRKTNRGRGGAQSHKNKGGDHFLSAEESSGFVAVPEGGKDKLGSKERQPSLLGDLLKKGSGMGRKENGGKTNYTLSFIVQKREGRRRVFLRPVSWSFQARGGTPRERFSGYDSCSKYKGNSKKK